VSPLRPGMVVRYAHPSWGTSRGRVLRVDGEPGRVLVQDLAPTGAREWWPAGECEVER
jgi:hypothetical protein